MKSNLSPDCLEAFPEPLLAVSPSGRLIAANQHAAQLLGIANDGAPEVTLREITDLSQAEFNSLLELCLATATPAPLRLSFYPTTGRPLSLRCEGWRCLLSGEASAIVRIFDEAEVSSRFSELTLMINQLNEACMVHRHSESRLRAALAKLHDIDSIRDHMLAQVSHDLRTPLNAILGMTEFMQTLPFGPLAGKYSEYVEDIHSSGDTLLQLVDQVLHLAWIDAQGDESTSEALADLGECLENCCRVVEPIIRMRGLQIVVPRFALKPRLRADQLLVKQILINLLGNAAKHAARGGNIEIKVEWRKGSTLVIQIKDDGPGISKAKLASINSGLLERNAYLTENSHSNFGLVLSCRTATAIGGRLDIRSSVGHGTVASLLLPAHLVEADQASVH